jgi:hypothetical protein
MYRAPALCVCLTLALPAQAGPNLDATAPAQPGAVGQHVMAQQLYATALTRQDRLAMLAAASIAGGHAMTTLDRPVEVSGDAPANAPDATPAPPDAAAMAATARAQIDPEETLALLLAETEAGNRLVPGATIASSPARLAPGQSLTLRLAFDGASPAEVGLIGDGDGRLTMTLVDAEGALICQPRSLSAATACGFVPAVSGHFTLSVANDGPGVADLLILTN